MRTRTLSKQASLEQAADEVSQLGVCHISSSNPALHLSTNSESSLNKQMLPQICKKKMSGNHAQAHLKQQS